MKLFQTLQLMLRFNNNACELSFQHTTTTQTLSMLTHYKWQKKLERVRMKKDKAITGSVITCHYTVLAICITGWVINGSNTDWYCSEKQSQQFIKTNDYYQIFPKKLLAVGEEKKNVLWFLFHVPNQTLFVACIFDYPYIFSSLSKTIRIIL